MAGTYDNNLTGVLFQNDKGDNEKRPDWRGSAEVDGKQYWVSGWEREKDGAPYISLKLELKDANRPKAGQPQQAPKQERKPAAAASQTSYDDIPF